MNLRNCLFLVIALALLASARERGPRVEIVCPAAPIPVRMNDARALVYELHVTNFDVVPLILKQVEVFGDNHAPLISLADRKLAAAMVHVGAPMNMSSVPASNGAANNPGSSETATPAKDSRTLDPGTRGVIYMWIEIPTATTPPATLAHRMVFSAAAADGKTTDATLENFSVPVSHETVLTLSPPFHGGTWLAGDGPANTTNHRRSIFAIDGHLYSPERFAIDWLKVGPNGDSRHDGSARNDNWWGWGEPVLAVADGEVTEVVDEFPDNTPRVLPPVTLDNIGGNHVILKIAPNRYVCYAHLQHGSIKVRLHDHVRTGDPLALLGNSGNTTGAHLHLQVTDRNSMLEAQGVPFEFAGFTYLGPGAEYELDKHVTVPWSHSIPPGDGVVEFPGGATSKSQ
jgi:murein DD-endopeptidase